MIAANEEEDFVSNLDTFRVFFDKINRQAQVYDVDDCHRDESLNLQTRILQKRERDQDEEGTPQH